MPKKLKFNSFKDNFFIPNNNYINIDAKKKIQIYYYTVLLLAYIFFIVNIINCLN